MTNQEMLHIAMQQSAIECGCEVTDFMKTENVTCISRPHPEARVYLQLPLFCDLTSYGSNVVATLDESVKDIVAAYIDKYDAAHCFETPNFHVLNDEMQKRGMRICFMAEYFLPDMRAMTEIPCDYALRVLSPSDFADLYLPEWGNALCERRKEHDVLAVGAYDGDTLIGLAGCSTDCESMWQIGVDVLPPYRRQGVAAAVTNRLAREIIARGKVPFYCCAWSNIASARNAIKSGFRPAWVQMTAKPIEVVEQMNR